MQKPEFLTEIRDIEGIFLNNYPDPEGNFQKFPEGRGVIIAGNSRKYPEY